VREPVGSLVRRLGPRIARPYPVAFFLPRFPKVPVKPRLRPGSAVSSFTNDVRHRVGAAKHCGKLRRPALSDNTATWPIVLLAARMRRRPIIRKVPGMTWFGHRIVHVSTALRTLPPAGQLMLIRDLRDFLDRQEQEIHRRQRARRPEATSI
jgi:hypothetical protein